MPFFTLVIDKGAFKSDVESLLQGSPLSSDLARGFKIEGWKTFPRVLSLIKAIVASVEIIKGNIIQRHDPDGKLGAKVDSALILDVAVEILDDLVVLDGLVGNWVEKWDRAAMEGLIHGVLAVLATPGKKNWYSLAKTILGIR